MKNFLGKFAGMTSNRKSLYFSAFALICFFVAMPVLSVHAVDFWGPVKGHLVSWTSTIVYELLKIALAFAALLVYFGAWMVDVMLNPAMYRSVLVGQTATDGTTAVSAVQIGWETIRDFCNMFYVFFLLLIAFATIVRAQSYNVKSLFPKFVISLFLINFSGVITKIAIDIGQIFLFGMAAWLGTFSGSSGGGSSLTGIVNYFTMQLGGKDKPGFEDIVTLLFAVVYSFVLGIMYIMLAAFLLFRLIMFAILIIISPFAFFSMVLPSMRGYTKQWSGQLVSNAISGPVFIFFVYISAMMAQNLTANPIASTAADGTASTSVSTLGDTSKMEYMVPFLTVIIPHVVAMGILLMAIPMAKSVGAAGSGYIIGGRGGIGKTAGLGYAGLKLGERGLRRTGSGFMRGSAWAKNRGVERFAGAADIQDKAHGYYQDKVAKIPFVGNNMAFRDMAAQDAAKKQAIESRLKSWGGNLKAIDVDLALKGDNIAKAIALQAAAEQGKLGDMDDKGNYKYATAEHFRNASAVMTQGDIKDLTGKNLALNAMTPENINKKKGDFSGEAATRIDANMKLGMSEGEAVQREIIQAAAVKSISKGKDGDIQGLDNAAVASALASAHLQMGTMDDLGTKSMKQKKELVKGLSKHAEIIETKRQDKNTNSETKEKLESAKIEFASAAIKSGANVDSALASGATIHYEKDDKGEYKVDQAGKKIVEKGGTSDFDRQADKLFDMDRNKHIKTADISKLWDSDKKEHGHRVTSEMIKNLRTKKDRETLGFVQQSLAAEKARLSKATRSAEEEARLQKVNEREEVVSSSLNVEDQPRRSSRDQSRRRRR